MTKVHGSETFFFGTAVVPCILATANARQVTFVTPFSDLNIRLIALMLQGTSARFIEHCQVW